MGLLTGNFTSDSFVQLRKRLELQHVIADKRSMRLKSLKRVEYQFLKKEKERKKERKQASHFSPSAISTLTCHFFYHFNPCDLELFHQGFQVWMFQVFFVGLWRKGRCPQSWYLLAGRTLISLTETNNFFFTLSSTEKERSKKEHIFS